LKAGPLTDAAQDPLESIDEEHADLARGNALHEPAYPWPLKVRPRIGFVAEVPKLKPTVRTLFNDEVPAYVRLMVAGIKAMARLSVSRHTGIDRDRHGAEFLSRRIS